MIFITCFSGVLPLSLEQLHTLPTSVCIPSAFWSSFTPKYVRPFSSCSWLKPFVRCCAPPTAVFLTLFHLSLSTTSEFRLYNHTSLPLKSNQLLVLSFSLGNVVKVEKNHGTHRHQHNLYCVLSSSFSFSTPPKVTANFPANHLLLQHLLLTGSLPWCDTVFISNQFDQSPCLALPY